MFPLSHIQFLKCVVVGALFVVCALGTPTQGEGLAQNLVPLGHHKPVLITVGSRVIAFCLPGSDRCALHYGRINVVGIVVLHLSVFNCDTGTLLYATSHRMPEFSINGNSMEDCRKQGVRRAHKLTEYFRATHPNVTTNVDCNWEWPAPAAPA
jgi:hypothetical protein